MSKSPYKILIVDDSRLIRQAIANIINGHEHLQVVGEAANGREALHLLPRLKPHLITLDVVMPEMSGLTTLKHIMIFHPTPVLMLSSVTQEGAQVTFDALRYGAIDFIAKPSQLDNESLNKQANEIVQKILVAVKVRINAIQYVRVKPKNPSLKIGQGSCKNIVVLGVAEGGYNALLKIIPRLKAYPNTVYMVMCYESATHIDSFIHYLNQYSELTVLQPQNNTTLRAGHCYFSLGESYITVHGEQGKCSVHVSPAPFSSRRGSIDMLMFSVAETVGRCSLGVILTGSGTDGAEGLEEIVRVGGGAIIQSPVSCLYKTMPLSALNACEAETVVSDAEIANEINFFLQKF